MRSAVRGRCTRGGGTPYNDRNLGHVVGVAAAQRVVRADKEADDRDAHHLPLRCALGGERLAQHRERPRQLEKAQPRPLPGPRT